MEITRANIKSFDTVAKKFHIDYALMKQEGSNRYYVFFKGADAEVLEAAFREYAKKEFHLEEKGSLRETLDAVEEKRSTRIQERKQNRKKKKVRTKSEVKVPELRR